MKKLTTIVVLVFTIFVCSGLLAGCGGPQQANVSPATTQTSASSSNSADSSLVPAPEPEEGLFYTEEIPAEESFSWKDLPAGQLETPLTQEEMAALVHKTFSFAGELNAGDYDEIETTPGQHSQYFEDVVYSYAVSPEYGEITSIFSVEGEKDIPFPDMGKDPVENAKNAVRFLDPSFFGPGAKIAVDISADDAQGLVIFEQKLDDTFMSGRHATVNTDISGAITYCSIVRESRHTAEFAQKFFEGYQKADLVDVEKAKEIALSEEKKNSAGYTVKVMDAYYVLDWRDGTPICCIETASTIDGKENETVPVYAMYYINAADGNVKDIF